MEEAKKRENAQMNIITRLKKEHLEREKKEKELSALAELAVQVISSRTSTTHY